jgi:hypothetical protein
MNEAMLCGAPTVEEIRIRFALPLLTCEVDHWREFLEGAKTSDLDSDRIGDLEEEIRGKNEAIGELEGRIERIGAILKSLRADLAKSQRSKLYPIVMERVKKIEEILKEGGIEP